MGTLAPLPTWEFTKGGKPTFGFPFMYVHDRVGVRAYNVRIELTLKSLQFERCR